MNGNCYYSEGINPTLTCNKNEGNRVAIPVKDIETNPSFNRRGVVHDVNGICRTVLGQGHAGNEPKVAIPVLTPDRATKRQNGRRFKEDGEEAFTLTSQDRHGVAIEVKPEKMGGVFAIDKGYEPEERNIANCIESREDRGLSRRKQEGTLICHKIN